jgi:hypothetical protein
MRYLIMAAPAWKPAFDSSLNKEVSSAVRFFVIVNKGKIDVWMDTKGKDKFE